MDDTVARLDASVLTRTSHINVRAKMSIFRDGEVRREFRG
jgi:hypothetical protein